MAKIEPLRSQQSDNEKPYIETETDKTKISNGMLEAGETPLGDLNSSGNDHLLLTEIEEKFRRLYEQSQQLMTMQLTLAKAEISEKVDQAEKGALRITVGGVFAFFGLQAFTIAAGNALVLVLPPWMAAVAVGIVLSVIGAAFLYAGRKNLHRENLIPRKTIRALKKNIEAVKEAV